MSVPIQIVDEDDQPIGQATKREAWDKGLRHRIVRIMIENDAGQLLLQHRSPTKDIFPDCWDNSAAGHVDAGESYGAAAVRELEEELGIKGGILEEIGHYASDATWRGHRLKRFTRVYKLRWNETPQKLEADKVDAVRWFTVKEIKNLIARHPEQSSDGLRQVLERHYIR